jgi:uncharacterized protein
VNALFLIAVSFCSSTLTAIIGLGGGILLISVMPGLLPATAIVPVHGVVQLASNTSRVLFGLRHVEWRVVGPFAVGAIVGAVVGSRFVVALPETYLPMIIGIFILVVIWVPGLKRAFRLPGKFASLGAIQTFISLFVGASGPMTTPFLLREGLPRDRIVVTHGALMTAVHLLKILTFSILGFAFSEYLYLMAGMVVSVTAGSYVGTRLRSHVSEVFFRKLFRVIVTLLALRMIVQTLI